MLSVGDWVQVKEKADIPALFRSGPTKGRVAKIYDDGTILVYVAIGIAKDPLTEHSQAVPYSKDDLEPVET